MIFIMMLYWKYSIMHQEWGQAPHKMEAIEERKTSDYTIIARFIINLSKYWGAGPAMSIALVAHYSFR